MTFYIILLCIIFFLAAMLIRSRLRLKSFQISLRDSQRHLKDKIQANTTGQAKLDAILTSMFEGILLTNARGEILFINPSLRKIFLVDVSGQGKRPIEVIRNVRIQEIVDQTLKGTQKLITEEISLTVPEEKFLKVHAVSISEGRGIEGAILVFHDITELRRLEKVRQDFVANVSHELRTPITSIKGYAETLLDGAMEDRENLRRFIEIIYRDSERLSKLIEDLLDLARIESGKMKIVLLPIDFTPVVQRTLGILGNQIKEKSLSIRMDFPKDGLKVLGDQTRLSQVMINLLDNAVKYTPDGGIISLSFSLMKDFVQVNVSDNGSGIPEKDIPRIFERFYRVDKARSRELGGTGLGLSIVKHIVQSHGGEIWAESELEHGTTLHFTLRLV